MTQEEFKNFRKEILRISMTINQYAIKLDGIEMVPITSIVNEYDFSYQAFYGFLVSFNTSDKIRYRKVGITKMLELNDLLCETILLYKERNENNNKFETLKNKLK